MDRRELIRVLGTSLAGMTLSACWDDGVTAPPRVDAPALPNGFRFYALKASDSSLPGSGVGRNLMADTAIDDVGEIFFNAVDAAGVRGVYAIRVDFTRPEPRVSSERKVVRVGDVLPGGAEVLAIGPYDTSPQGALVVVLEVPHPDVADDDAQTTREIWVDTSKGGLRRLVSDGFVTRDGHVLSGVIGDVDIHTGHNLLFVAWYRHKDPNGSLPTHEYAADDDVMREGLFSMQGVDPSTCELELHSDQLATPGASASIGLIDAHDGGHYVLQAHPARGYNTADAGAAAALAGSSGGGAAIITGRVGERRPRVEIAARGIAGAALLAAGAGPAGESFLGPRAGPEALTAYVLHESESTLVLYHHGHRIVATGDRSPGGSTVGSITPPVFGREGEIYYTLMTRDGPELCAANGDEQRLLLSHDDQLANDSRAITSLMLGHTTEGTDAAGHLALVTVFADNTAAVTVGIPA